MKTFLDWSADFPLLARTLTASIVLGATLCLLSQTQIWERANI